MIQTISSQNQKASGYFNPMYLCLSKGMTLPQDKKYIPFSKYETGVLTYGNSNPHDENYNSLSDFCEKDGKIEIRIPWQLLNVMDPSTKAVMADFHQTIEFSPQQIEGFYFGIGVIKKDQANGIIGMNFYSWETWEIPTYHERLKPSYYIMQKAFEKIQ